MEVKEVFGGPIGADDLVGDRVGASGSNSGSAKIGITRGVVLTSCRGGCGSGVAEARLASSEVSEWADDLGGSMGVGVERASCDDVGVGIGAARLKKLVILCFSLTGRAAFLFAGEGIARKCEHE